VDYSTQYQGGPGHVRVAYPLLLDPAPQFLLVHEGQLLDSAKHKDSDEDRPWIAIETGF
jgi:hypothetical protein